jgi:hypothetical protein
MAKKINYGYKYKPTAASLFKPAAQPKDTKSYIEGQISGLEKRFQGVGVDTTQPEKDIDKRNLVEKALNLTPDQGVVMDILEVLDRPREVVSNVLSSLSDKDKRNLLEAAWEGLAGKNKLSTREALQNLTGDDDFLTIKEDSKSYWDDVGNIVIDIGLDIAADPTTYLGFGMFTKPIKGALKAAGKGVAKVGGAALDVAKASKKLKPAAEATEGFVKGVAKFLDNASYSLNATKGLTDDQVRAIKKISAKAGQTADELKVAIDDVTNILIKSKIKNADNIAKEIIETGSELVQDAGTKAWRVVTPDGKIIMDDIIREFSQKVKGIKPNAKAGQTIAEKIIPINLKRVSKEVSEQLTKYVDKLNNVAGKPIFAIREASGSVALQFKGTADEFFKIVNNTDAYKVIGNEVINFGARKLSQETLEAISKNGDVLKSATDKMRNIQAQTRKFLEQMGEFNVGTKTLASNVEYLRRVPTAQAEEFFKGQKYVVTDYVRPGTSDLASRSYEGTTKEINEALKNLYGASDDLFNESALLSLQDLVNVAQKRYTQTNLTKMLLGVEFDPITKTYKELENAPKFFFATEGKTAKEVAEQLPSGYQVLKGNFKDEFSNLWKNLPPEMQKAFDNQFLESLSAATQDGVVAMQKSAYNVLKNADNAYKEIPELVKFYDKMLGTWKSVTLLSPGFHGRNFMGNATNMYLAGMNTADIIRYQSKAVKDYNKFKRLAKLRAEIGEQALKQSDRVFLNNFDEIARSGVLTGHRGARDLEDVKSMVERLGQGKELKKKGVLEKLIKDNFSLSEEMDDIQRIALYRWSLKKTGNSASAFKQVREALFDYTLLTPFERNYAKRLIPFYTFMKNNMIFQAKNIVNNPNQYAKLLRGYKHWTEGMTDMDINELPEYMVQNMWVPFPTIVDRGDGETINFLKTNLPPSDFAELISKPFSKGVNSLTAPLKLGIELGIGRDTFTGAPLKEFPGQTNRMEKETGVLPSIRGQDCEAYLSKDPVIQKIADDLGLRNPRKLVTALLDIADVTTGKQSFGSFVDDLGKIGGITTTKNLSEIELTSLYQKLEELRNLKKLYEQETGGELPTQAELQKRAGYLYKPK